MLREKMFTDEHGSTHAFPSLADASSLALTVVVPAYNEELRLPAMLDDCLHHLHATMTADAWEVIVVDDGSRDATTDVAMRYTDKCTAERVRVLTLAKNRGKGAELFWKIAIFRHQAAPCARECWWRAAVISSLRTRTARQRSPTSTSSSDA